MRVFVLAAVLFLATSTVG
jgi:RTX calcium-binding nonapeptide repeat (4 copies)